MATETRGEDRVRIAARLYDARRAVRSLAGDDYPRLVAEWKRLIRLAMDKFTKKSNAGSVNAQRP